MIYICIYVYMYICTYLPQLRLRIYSPPQKSFLLIHLQSLLFTFLPYLFSVTIDCLHFLIILYTLNQIVCTSASTFFCLALFIHMIVLLLGSINSAFPFLGVAFHCMQNNTICSHSADEHFCCFDYYS